jgi:hypothetical protein
MERVEAGDCARASHITCICHVIIPDTLCPMESLTWRGLREGDRSRSKRNESAPVPPKKGQQTIDCLAFSAGMPRRPPARPFFS